MEWGGGGEGGYVVTGSDESAGGQKKKKGTRGPSWLPIDVPPKLRPNSSVKPNRPLHLGPGLVGDGPDRMAQVTSPESRTEKAAGCQRRTGSPLRPVAFMEFRCHSLQAWGEFPQGQRLLAPPAGRAIESSTTGSGVQNGILSGIPETRELSCRLPPAATPDKECRACASVSETVHGHPPSPCQGVAQDSPASRGGFSSRGRQTAAKSGWRVSAPRPFIPGKGI